MEIFFQSVSGTMEYLYRNIHTCFLSPTRSPAHDKNRVLFWERLGGLVGDLVKDLGILFDVMQLQCWVDDGPVLALAIGM